MNIHTYLSPNIAPVAPAGRALHNTAAVAPELDSVVLGADDHRWEAPAPTLVSPTSFEALDPSTLTDRIRALRADLQVNSNEMQSLAEQLRDEGRSPWSDGRYIDLVKKRDDLTFNFQIEMHEISFKAEPRGQSGRARDKRNQERPADSGLMRKLSSIRQKPLLVLVALFGFACSTQERLIGVQTEHEAMEILEALRLNGPAETPPNERHTSASVQAIGGRGGGFEVMISREELDRARAILLALGLPRPAGGGIAGLEGSGGLIENRDRERARMLHAQSQELARTLEQMSGVRFARVHLTMPHEDPFATEVDTAGRSPRAAVLLVYEGGDEARIVESAKRVVRASIDGLTDVGTDSGGALAESIEVVVSAPDMAPMLLKDELLKELPEVRKNAWLGLPPEDLNRILAIALVLCGAMSILLFLKIRQLRAEA